LVSLFPPVKDTCLLIDGSGMSVHRFFSLSFVAVGLFVALVGCNIFRGTESTDELGWKKASMPKLLKGEWYLNDFFYMRVASLKVTVDNREWTIETIYEKDGVYRLVVKSNRQYMAMYFQNIAEHSVEKSFGYITFSPYEAKLAGREEWVVLKRE